MPNSIETIANAVPQLRDYLEDQDVSEIMINGDGTVWYEIAGKIDRIPLNVKSEMANEFAVHVARLCGKDIGEEMPMLNAKLEDGSRIQIVYPPASVGAASLSIRKFQGRFFSLEALQQLGMITARQAERLESLVKSRTNLLISGATSSGKTTLLNACANQIDESHRIAVIEDTAEIQIDRPNVIRYEARGAADHRSLLTSVLRLRPDRIIFGEVRGREAFDLLQGLNTGHEGSLSTIHANSPRTALNKLGTLALTALPELSFEAVQRDISTAFQAAVHVVRKDGHRYLDSISLIQDYDYSRREFVLTQID